MEMNFCRRCGSKIDSSANGVFTCSEGHAIYNNAAPAVGIFFVTDDSHLLLSVRGIEPFKGCLDSFGGFIDDQETAEDGLARELVEELGLTPDQYEPPRFLSTETGFYPYGGETRSILSLFYWSRLLPGANPIPADDVAGIEKVMLADIDMEKMDNTDVRKALLKLQALLL